MDPKHLSKVPLFQKLPPNEIDLLAEKMKETEISAEDILFREGDHGDHFYVIAEGELEVIKALGKREERLIAVRGDGEFLGELSLINPDGIRMACVRAKTDAKLWQLSREDFETALYENPTIATQIVRELSQRLTTAHEKTIFDLQTKNFELTTAYNELRAAQEQIIVKERLEHELALAQEIQKSILPVSLPQTGQIGFGAFLKPARAVGGDFYDIFAIDESRVCIMIGDVTDKGVPAALVMAQTHALLYSEALRGADPGEVLEQVNREVARINHSGLFITAIYGLLNTKKREFSYARAGHEVPLLQVGDAPPGPLPHATGQPVGLIDDPLFDLQTVKLPPGARLLLHTDGALDMHNGAGEQFGMERLQAAFRSSLHLSPQFACEEIYQQLEDFQGHTPQDDDLTLIVIQSV
jgi:sigma-B regulation protein RsbU (phosphoserine phosphatase)